MLVNTHALSTTLVYAGNEIFSLILIEAPKNNSEPPYSLDILIFHSLNLHSFFFYPDDCICTFNFSDLYLKTLGTINKVYPVYLLHILYIKSTVQDTGITQVILLSSSTISPFQLTTFITSCSCVIMDCVTHDRDSVFTCFHKVQGTLLIKCKNRAHSWLLH